MNDLPSRALATGVSSVPAVVPKAPIRLITAVWGQTYIDELLEFCLPALLAPGNLPALVKEFSCELVLVTEECLFDYVRRNRAFAAISELCPTRLVMIDDLVVSRNMYGHSLTFGLHRGFEDLGPKMCETNLLFFNSDFILADGSLDSVAKALRDGERLIFAPSYCVVAEDVAPLLRERIDPATGVLRLPPREMAAIAIPNRHYTIRGKTVNEPNYHMNIVDQFYWLVDGTALIGHQMPIAIVCMRPQRVYTDPVSFWDYATISMACPTARRHVLGDSDDFLMIELRSAKTYTEFLRIGGVTPEQVAKTLGEYMTSDQFEMGRYPLVLHSEDLPPEADAARRELKAYVDRVYAALPAKPVPHINHPYWSGLIDQFVENKHQWHQNHQSDLLHKQLMAEESRRIRGGAPLPVTVDATSARPANLVRRFAREAYDVFVGSLPRTGPANPYTSSLRHVIAILDGLLGDGAPLSLIVKRPESFVCRLIEQHRGTYLAVSPEYVSARNPFTVRDPFDLCLIEPSWTDLAIFPAMYEHIRPHMRRGSHVVLFYCGPELESLAEGDVETLLPLLPRGDRCRTYFAGGEAIAAALNGFRNDLERYRSLPPRRRVMAILRELAQSAPSVIRANRASELLPPHQLPPFCTSIAIDIEILEPA
jgi:hypothetical protein